MIICLRFQQAQYCNNVRCQTSYIIVYWSNSILLINYLSFIAIIFHCKCDIYWKDLTSKASLEIISLFDMLLSTMNENLSCCLLLIFHTIVANTSIPFLHAPSLRNALTLPAKNKPITIMNPIKKPAMDEHLTELNGFQE